MQKILEQERSSEKIHFKSKKINIIKTIIIKVEIKIKVKIKRKKKK